MMNHVGKREFKQLSKYCYNDIFIYEMYKLDMIQGYIINRYRY